MDTSQVKDIFSLLLLVMVSIAFIIGFCVSGWKEYHRHNEVNEFIELLGAQNNRLNDANKEIFKESMNALARQKSLILLRDSDGYLTIKALDTAEKEEVREALEKQDDERDPEE